jgi:uridine phosphorylase
MPLEIDKAVIEPRRGKTEQPLPPLGVMLFTPQDVDLFVQWAPRCEKRARKIYLADVYTGSLEGASFALAGPMLGAPQAVLVLEKLIALGVQEVAAVGWCGSLQPYLHIGDLVLPTRAFSEEGASSHYPIDLEQPGPDAALLEALRRACRESSLRFFQGPVWTTDAPYRETVSKVTAYRKRDVLAVEMETSALLIVARFRGIRLAVVLVASDDLSSLKWRHGFKDPTFREVRRKLPELVLGSLASGASQEEGGKGFG